MEKELTKAVKSERKVGSSLRLRLSLCCVDVRELKKVQKKLKEELQEECIRRSNLTEKFEMWREEVKVSTSDNYVLLKKDFDELKNALQANASFMRSRLVFYDHSDLQNMKKQKEKLISEIKVLSERNDQMRERVSSMKGMLMEAEEAAADSISEAQQQKVSQKSSQISVLCVSEEAAKRTENETVRFMQVHEEQLNTVLEKLNFHHKIDHYINKFESYQRLQLLSEEADQPSPPHHAFPSTPPSTSPPSINADDTTVWQVGRHEEGQEKWHEGKEEDEEESKEKENEEEKEENEKKEKVDSSFLDSDEDTHTKDEKEGLITSRNQMSSNYKTSHLMSKGFSPFFGDVDLHDVRLFLSSEVASAEVCDFLLNCCLAEVTLNKFRNYSVMHQCSRLKKKLKNIKREEVKLHEVQRFLDEVATSSRNKEEMNKCRMLSKHKKKILLFKKRLEKHQRRVNGCRENAVVLLVRLGLGGSEEQRRLEACWQGRLFEEGRETKLLSQLIEALRVSHTTSFNLL